jgi:hypothetical protein
MSKYTIDIPRAATLDNLFSPKAGTEIPYVSPAAQCSLRFPYKYCMSLTNIVYLLGKYTGLCNNWRTCSYTYYTIEN